MYEYLRNVFGRPTAGASRLDQAGLVSKRDDRLPDAQPIEAAAPLKTLVAEITARLADDPADFFSVVDEAKARFRRDIDGDLQTALIGLKISNLLIAKYEYLRGSVATTAHPVGFMLDTANQCQLGCPSCTNSFNRDVAEATFNPWPRGLLKQERFDAFINTVGISAFAGHFYNNHEPFLNKNTPAYLRVASDMQIDTFASSNLSFPKLDHEAIVLSGLKTLMVALDGVTQESYQKYRKGGRLDWAFANVRAIAEAKKRLGLSTPHIRWQWLTFEHNVHEVERGIAVAREVGFDSFNLATPNRVDHDDPTVRAVQYEGPEEHKDVVINARVGGNFGSVPESYRELVDQRLAESALARWTAAGGPEADRFADRTGDRCDWLHMAVIGDAKGRIVPCCNGDYKLPGSFVFSTIDEHHDNIMNSRLYREARLLLADPVAYRRATLGQKSSERPRCVTCPLRPRPQIGLGAVGGWLAWSQKPEMQALNAGEVENLYNWSLHQSIRPNHQTARLAYEGPVDGARFGNVNPPTIEGIGELIVAESDTVMNGIDLYANAVVPLTVRLMNGDKLVGEASAAQAGWQHFRLSTMTTPGAYTLQGLVGDDPVDLARIDIANGNAIRIRPSAVQETVH